MRTLKTTGALLTMGFALAACRWGFFSPSVEVAIHGQWVNTEDPPTPKDGCAVHFTTSQVGEATHLGPFDGAGFTCVPSPPEELDEPPHFSYDPAPPYFVAEFENEMIWATRGGDELWLGPSDGVFVQSVATGQVSVEGLLRISGGTGRFSGASGELSVRNATEDGLTLEFKGTLTLDRS